MSKYQLEYQKKETRVLIGNGAIPDNLVNQYIGTLCFEVETTYDVKKLIDISVSREQLEELVATINGYLNYATKHPPHEERPLPKSDTEVADRKNQQSTEESTK